MSTNICQRRASLIAATAKAGRDSTLDFDTRVRYARAAAIGTILFGQPPPADGSVPLYSPLAAAKSLQLPTSAEVGPLLDTYKAEVEWLCSVVIIDLNRARIESFLDWWHSSPQTLPADPPLVPLVLCVVALAIQARRLSKYCTFTKTQHTLSSSSQAKEKTQLARHIQDDIGSDTMHSKEKLERESSPQVGFLDNVSSEKELLETAGRCIDVLQIVCPSNWASAFSAPLDLVRANLLRGIWHMSEVHLQFAGSCFAATMRLAYAAALNHDTSHWPTMGTEEAQARRNIFWNVAQFERMHSSRVVQPSVTLPLSFDTKFPDDYAALQNLYRLGGLIEPFVIKGRRSNVRLHPMTKDSFDFFTESYRLTNVLVQGHFGSRAQDKQKLAEGYGSWFRSLSPVLKAAVEGRKPVKDAGTAETDPLRLRTRYLQDAFLQMISLSAQIQIHRPQVDETGRWRPPEGQAQRSLQLCIESAQRQVWHIHSIITQEPGPPFSILNHCIFFCFQAAIVIAIQSAISARSKSGEQHVSSFAAKAQPSLDRAVLTLETIAGESGLRWVAEQAGHYAATLRDIDTTHRDQPNTSSSDCHGAERDAQYFSASRRQTPAAQRNMERPALGVHPLAIAEGDGKKMGGQGYPVGSAASDGSKESTALALQSSSYAHKGRHTTVPVHAPQSYASMLPPPHFSKVSKEVDSTFSSGSGDVLTSDLDGMLRTIFFPSTLSDSFGIGFDDLAMPGGAPQTPVDARLPPGYFADRPTPSVFGSLPQHSSEQLLPLEAPAVGGTSDHSLASLGGLIAPAQPARSDQAAGGTGHDSFSAAPWQSGSSSTSKAANSGSAPYPLQGVSGSAVMSSQQQEPASTLQRRFAPTSTPTQQGPSRPADLSLPQLSPSSSSASSGGHRSLQLPTAPRNGSQSGLGSLQSMPAAADGVLAWVPVTADRQDLDTNSSLTSVAGAKSAPFPHATAPALETLSDSFALDWQGWERAVERLLHTER